MSWSFTVNDMEHAGPELPAGTLEEFEKANEKYPLDMAAAWNLARLLGLRSATLSGSRTETPYNNDEVVVVTITGLTNAAAFFEAMRGIVKQPEQAIPPDSYTALEHARCRICGRLPGTPSAPCDSCTDFEPL